MPEISLIEENKKVLLAHRCYDSLNENSPHRLIGNGTSQRCGLVGVSVALLEEVCHCGLGLEVPTLKLYPVWHIVTFCCLWIKT